MADSDKLLDVDLSTSKDTKEKVAKFFTSPLFISLAIIIIAAAGIVFAVMKSNPPELPQAPDKEIATGQLDNPKVTLETYEDFVCPHCGEFNPIYNQLLDKYKGQSVKFVFHNFPFLSSNSRWAAEASEYAADKGKFEEYKNKIFDEQKKVYDVNGEDPTFAKEDNLIKWAGEIGLDSNDLKKNLDGRTYKTRIDHELDAAKKRNVNSTPTIYINGTQFQQDASKGIYLDVDGLSKVIDEQLAK